MEENKPISGDAFIIETCGALFCVACDFVAGQIYSINTHMKVKHNAELKGNMTKRLTKQTTVPKDSIEKRNCVKKPLNEERYARNYIISQAPAPGMFPC